MKRIITLLSVLSALVVILAACTSTVDGEKWVLDKKHAPFPDYVVNAPEKIQETYVIASQYPEVVAQVPCYCGCYLSDGHESNLDCFIDQFDKNNAVQEWDSMGIA